MIECLIVFKSKSLNSDNDSSTNKNVLESMQKKSQILRNPVIYFVFKMKLISSFQIQV